MGEFIIGLLLFLWLIGHLNSESNKPKDLYDPSDYKWEPPRDFHSEEIAKTYRDNKAEEKAELAIIQKKYKEHILSTKWYKIRENRKKQDSYACVICGATDDLNVHHITYKHLGYEPLKDLRTLCSDCHTDIHEQVGYPQTTDCYKTKVFWK